MWANVLLNLKEELLKYSPKFKILGKTIGEHS